MKTFGLAFVCCLIPVCSGCLAHRFDSSSFNGSSYIDDSTLRILVVREIGTSTSELGPCPKSNSTIDRRIVYAIEYNLASGSTSDSIKPTVKILSDERSPGVSASVPTPDTGIPDLLAMPNREEKYRSAIEGHGMGFDATYVIESDDGDHLALEVPMGWGNARLVSLRSGKSQTSPMEVNFRAIWDCRRKRILALNNETKSKVIGMPTSVTVWNYADGTEQLMQLDEPKLGISRR